MIIWITAALPWLRDRAEEFADFLRSIPNLLAPKPTPLASPVAPPFTGGQCPTLYAVTYILYQTNMQDVESFAYAGQETFNLQGAIGGGRALLIGLTPSNGYERIRWQILSNGSWFELASKAGGGGLGMKNARTEILSVSRVDGQPDSCGNVGNTSTPPSIPDDGLFNPVNPNIGDDNGTLNPAAIVLAPALPLVLVSAILGGYAAAMAAAQAASNALDAIKKVAEGLDALRSLWEKLKEFLDEWEKNRPKKRDIVRQTYGQIVGDGAIDFFPNNNTKFQAIQLDVIITNIPIGFGRYFGSLSPSRYRYRELGYIAFYSTNQGILETHSIQFKRTSYQIPELAVGFIYHLGLDDQVRGYSFGTFSVEKT